jgi:EmrB/QacA subfamily drug resistance transporter
VSRQRTYIVVAGIMLSLFMASMEATVIATAMPTIVSQLGGLEIYSWAFAAYMLTSTCTVPVYGKLSDIYGRRIIYAIAMTLFLVGSILCGLSQSMEQLIFFRALQGIGAGGVLPLAFIIIGDIFSFEQRAKMQGFFAGVWGVSSIIGPVLGGFLVDQASWHWVFYVNIIPGVIAFALVWFGLRDELSRKENVAIDYAGAVLLIAAVALLLLGLGDLGNLRGISFVVVAVILFVLLWVVERRAVDPVLPLSLFRDRLFITASLHGMLAGWAMFGTLSFVPLFVQSVMGASATEAGTTITPMMLGWVLASVVGGRLLLRIGYRTVALAGMVMLTLGAFLVSQSGTDATRNEVMIYLTMMGIGMGLSVPSFLIAVQSSVSKRTLGTATSTLQFSRSIGGTLGVSVMGALLTVRLTEALVAAGLDPNAVSLNSMIDSAESAVAAVTGPMRDAMATAIESIFVLAFIAAALGLVATAFAPHGRVGQLGGKSALNEAEGEEAGASTTDFVPEI